MLSVVERIKGFLFSPSETFDASKEDTLGTTFEFFIALLTICAVLSGVMGWLVFYHGVTMFVLVLILGIIGVFIGGLWTHVWIYLVGGRKGVTQTLKALMYGATPGCLLGWIPIVGVFAVVWTLILEIVGIGQLHELSTRRAVLAVIFAISIPLTVPYAATGTWRVGFAIESGSMEPNMHAGDLIFVQAPARTEIITYEEGEALGYKSFDEYGDVIVYRPGGRPPATPILHRAMYWVEEGEEMPNGKPAPHAGYITKGDNNAGFDQPMLGVEPVKPEWVVAVAKVRIPYLGYPSIILKKGF
jgi:signal peptidase